MKIFFTKNKRKFIAISLIVILTVITIIAFTVVLTQVNKDDKVSQPQSYVTSLPVSYSVTEQSRDNFWKHFANFDLETVEAKAYEKTEMEIPENYELTEETKLASFIKLEENKLIINPTKKAHVQSVNLKFFDEQKPVYYNLKVKLKEVDFEKLKNDIEKILGKKKKNYGVYVKDLLRDQELGINDGKKYPPASIGKVPVAILTLRDIEAGKYKYSTTYPIQEKYKHSTTYGLGLLPQGTQITIREYLEKTLIVSSNTAMYHLRGKLGDVGKVYARTRDELGAEAFSDYPYSARADNVGKVFEDLYFNRTLSEKYTKFFYNKLGSAVDWLRQGIWQAVPHNGEAKVVSKMGVSEGNIYADAGIVWGKKTDFILVILDENTSVTEGQDKIHRITRLVYNRLNK